MSLPGCCLYDADFFPHLCTITNYRGLVDYQTRYIFARSIEGFALPNIHRHADVLTVICGGVLRCYCRGFLDRVRLNNNERASQLRGIQ